MDVSFCKNPEGKFSIIFPREHGHEYSVSHNGDNFYFLTNKNAKTFKLVAAGFRSIRKNWREVIPSRTDVTLEGVDFLHIILLLLNARKACRKCALQISKQMQRITLHCRAGVFCFSKCESRFPEQMCIASVINRS